MIRVVVGELVAFRGEAVLRTMRSDLDPGSARSRAVAERAGAQVQARLETGGEIPVGGAVMTPAGDLPADFIIHVVTCSRDEPETSLTVQRALRNGLRRAVDWEVATLALPPMGLGVGVMEPEEAARVQVEILVDHLEGGAPPREIVLLVANAYEEEVFARAVALLAPDADGPAGNQDDRSRVP